MPGPTNTSHHQKNALKDSNISSKGNVQIGDNHYYYPHETKGKHAIKMPLILKIALSLSIVIGVSITVRECYWVKNEYNIGVGEDDAKESQRSDVRAEKNENEAKNNPTTAGNKNNNKQNAVPKPTVPSINVMEVTAAPEGYKGLFSSKMGEMLRGANINYQLSGTGKIMNQINCTFDLRKSKIESGMREAFRYSLTLQLEVIGNSGQSCFSGFYTSESRIGYPEDSEDVLRSKVIEPCLVELKNAFQQNLPTLCEGS
jgi:hypothetical protein